MWSQYKTDIQKKKNPEITEKIVEIKNERIFIIYDPHLQGNIIYIRSVSNKVLSGINCLLELTYISGKNGSSAGNSTGIIPFST